MAKGKLNNLWNNVKTLWTVTPKKRKAFIKAGFGTVVIAFAITVGVLIFKSCNPDETIGDPNNTDNHDITMAEPSDESIGMFDPEIEGIITPDEPIEEDSLDPETEEVTTEDESESVTEPPITPDNGANGNSPDDKYTEEEVEAISYNFSALIKSLNARISEFLGSKNNSRCPTITGIEVVNVSKKDDGYYFQFRVEGTYDNINMAYFNLNAFNKGHEGANICDLADIDDIDLASALSQLEEATSSNNTEIESFKELKQAEIINKALTVKRLIPWLSNTEASKATVNAYVMTSAQPAKGDFKYGNKVVIKAANKVYLTNITIQSPEPLTPSELNDLLTRYLAGHSITSYKIKVDEKTSEADPNNLNSALEEIKEMIGGTTNSTHTHPDELEDDSIDLGL